MAIQTTITDSERPKATLIPAVVAPVTNGTTRHVSQLRRFERPDIERHGAWLVPRFLTAFPHLNSHQAMSFMVNVLYSNEFMFLYQPHGVALAQIMLEQTLQEEPIVWERFVFLEDPKDARHIAEGIEFYAEFERWTKQKHAKQLVVEQCSDVPTDAIKEQLGRILIKPLRIAQV